MTKLTNDEKSDIRIQLSIALLGSVTGAMRAIRARVNEAGKLALIAYFDRHPYAFELEKLEDSLAEAIGSFYTVQIEGTVECVVTKHPTFGIEELEGFEETHFGASEFSIWLYARYGEVSGDDERLVGNRTADLPDLIEL